MGAFSGSGGGYFYGAFSRAQVLGPFQPLPGIVNVYGAWFHIANLAFRSRWLNIDVYPGVPIQPAIYEIQLARGVPGAEALWLPLLSPGDPSGFFFDMSQVVGPLTGPYQVPYQISFPVTIDDNEDVSVRVLSTAPIPVIGVTVWLTLFN